MPYEIHDTSHVEKRARERGFTVEQAVLTVNDPGSILKTPPRRGNHGGMLWLFFRTFDSRLLVVVAEIKLNDCWIITGYWDSV
jgi:hypothetical protein